MTGDIQKEMAASDRFLMTKLKLDTVRLSKQRLCLLHRVLKRR